MQSGMANASRLKKDIRQRVYPRGTGFMITVKPHGRQGFHTNRFGLQKPVLMWVEAVTKVRYVRKGGGDVDVGQSPHHHGEEPLSQSLRRPGAIQTRGGMITKRAKKLAVNNFSSRLKPA